MSNQPQYKTDAWCGGPEKGAAGRVAPVPAPAPAVALAAKCTRIVIAGGERSLQSTYAHFMEQRGFSTCCLRTAQEVEACLARTEEMADLLLIDEHLPGLRGALLFHRVRAACPKAAIFLLCADAGRQLGTIPPSLAVLSLGKPLTAETLLTAVRRACVGAASTCP